MGSAWRTGTAAGGCRPKTCVDTDHDAADRRAHLLDARELERSMGSGACSSGAFGADGLVAGVIVGLGRSLRDRMGGDGSPVTAGHGPRR